MSESVDRINNKEQKQKLKMKKDKECGAIDIWELQYNFACNRKEKKISGEQ